MRLGGQRGNQMPRGEGKYPKPVEASQGRTKRWGQATANRVTLGDRGKHNPKRGDPKHVKRALRENTLRLKKVLPLGDSEKRNLS